MLLEEDLSRQQVEVVGITWHDIASTEAFAQGYDDVLKGLPPRFEETFAIGGKRPEHAWQYERGRHFAVWCLAAGETPVLWLDGAEGLHLNPRIEDLGSMMATEGTGVRI